MLSFYIFGGGKTGTILQDSKRLSVSNRSLKKLGEVLTSVDLIGINIKQLPQDACIVQSEASIWCIYEAERLVENRETIKTKATATRILFFFVMI